MSMLETPRPTVEQITDMVIGYILDELAPADVGELTADDNILTGGYIDSVGVVRLTGYMSDRLGMSIPATDLIPANFRSPRIMAEYLHGRLSAG